MTMLFFLLRNLKNPHLVILRKGFLSFSEEKRTRHNG